jgi:hypothetical protein
MPSPWGPSRTNPPKNRGASKTLLPPPAKRTWETWVKSARRDLLLLLLSSGAIGQVYPPPDLASAQPSRRIKRQDHGSFHFSKDLLA